MKNRFYILSLVFVLFNITSYSQSDRGVIKGEVKDSATKVRIDIAIAELFQNGIKMIATPTDPNGIFEFSEIKPGAYDLTVSFSGYRTQIFKGILIQNNAAISVQVNISTIGKDLPPIKINYRNPNIAQTNIPETKPNHKEVIKIKKHYSNNDLKSIVKTDWHYNPKENTFGATGELREKISHQDPWCFKGMSIKKVQSLFGTPNYSTSSNLHYCGSPNCTELGGGHQGQHTGAFYTDFNFDKGKLIQIVEGCVSTIND